MNLFRKKKTTATVIAELKAEQRKLTDSKLDLKLDLRENEKSISKMIARGTKAHLEGDSLGKSEAALELQTLRAEGSGLLNRLNEIIKTELLSRDVIRTLESAERHNNRDAVSAVMKILSDPDLQDKKKRAEITVDSYQLAVHRAFDRLKARLGDISSAINTETTNEELLFEELAKAQESGDVNKVREINAKLSGTEGPKKTFEDDGLKI